ILRVTLPLAALLHGELLELEEAHLPAKDFAEDELRLLADHVAQRRLVDLAHVHEHAAEPSGRRGRVLALECFGQVLLADQTAGGEERPAGGPGRVQEGGERGALEPRDEPHVAPSRRGGTRGAGIFVAKSASQATADAGGL